MAGGQLVPHTLPDGRVVMVPDYVVPQQALALPNVPAPQRGPDERTAFSGPDFRLKFTGPATESPESPNILSGSAPPIKIRTDFSGGLGGPSSRRRDDVKKDSKGVPRINLGDPNASPLTAADEEKPEYRLPTEQELKADEHERAARKQAKGVDPSTLDTGGPREAAPSQGDGGDEMNPLVRAAMRYSPGGGGPRRSGGMEVGTIKEQREPGRELLPEQMWRMGLAERPKELYEVDPTVPQSTIGTDEPVMRERQTGLERGASAAGDAARKEYELQLDAAHKQSIAERQNLADQSNLIDEQLGTIADRRNRIAKLQEVADQRAREADSIEPRTRSQIWEDRGTFAQIMGGLSMAIGGYTQGLGRNGGHNPGMEMINKMLDSAVDDERYKHERRQKIGMSAKSDLDKAMAIYGDLDLATLDAKNRKLANVMALTKSMAADPSTDPMAKERAAGIYNSMYDQYLEGVRKLAEGIQGRVLTQEVNFKQAPATGGGGGGNDPLKMLERGAKATEYVNKIEGKGQATSNRSIEGDKLNDVNAAMETLDAADSIDRDLDALGIDSDIDDPLSGPLDAAARITGLGGRGRQARQSLARNTTRLARGIQQTLGKSDNDAKLADQMAAGEGDEKSRRAAANIARQQSLGRIQTAMAGMTPQQRDAFLAGLPPERRAQVQAAGSATAAPRRAASEGAAD